MKTVNNAFMHTFSIKKQKRTFHEICNSFMGQCMGHSLHDNNFGEKNEKIPSTQ